MRFLSLFTTFLIATTASILGFEHTFVLQDVNSNQFLALEGDVSSRKSPYCTFNIALSLIGFDANFLHDAENPLLPFKDAYEEEYRKYNDSFPEKWKAPHNPTSWMKNSCVWYSQTLTRQMGIKTLSNYITAFKYGNQNLIGDAGKANGLTHAWIGSSLRISPVEQVQFINQFLKQELPISENAYAFTKAILFIEDLPNGMRLYGKTGSGDYANGRQELESKIGWFVGWVEKNNMRLAFAYKVQGDGPSGIIPGLAAREQLKKRLTQLPF